MGFLFVTAAIVLTVTALSIEIKMRRMISQNERIISLLEEKKHS
jgi:hypothetical protein